MFEIRIEKKYNGHAGAQTFVMLKQIAKGTGKVIYTEDFYPSKNSRAIRSTPIEISAEKANAIYNELKQTARPYIRYNENDMFSPMK